MDAINDFVETHGFELKDGLVDSVGDQFAWGWDIHGAGGSGFYPHDPLTFPGSSHGPWTKVQAIDLTVWHRPSEKEQLLEACREPPIRVFTGETFWLLQSIRHSLVQSIRHSLVLDGPHLDALISALEAS